MQLDLHGKQLIAGQATATSGHTCHATNPATAQRLTTDFAEATRAEVDRACTLAAQSFDAVRARPAKDRAA
ncbi:MAG: aldehyde dehydrogenase (NADP(+)), partial [Phycisphaerae bacterium]